MKEWVKEFFNEPNKWALTKINGGGYPKELQGLLFDMLSNME